MSQPFSSLTCVQARLSFLMAANQAALSSSSDTPSTVKFLFLNLLYANTTLGFSWRQGPHQLAQKSIKTYLPRKEERVNGFPATSFIVKSGAMVLLTA